MDGLPSDATEAGAPGDTPLRCPWCGTDPLYVAYHDEEWGVPVRDDRALFEKLALESFQSGLSWITILRKRPAFREAFAGFDPARIVHFGDADRARLMADAGIVRNRAKIDATIANARAWLDCMESGPGFSALVWDVVDGRPVQEQRRQGSDIPAETPASRTLAKTLKARGFRFFGPVTAYAFMQSMGLVNDHLLTCHRHAEVARHA